MSMQFELQRIERIVKDIGLLRHPISIPVSRYKMYEGKLEHGERCDTSGWKEYEIETSWNALDAHRWIRTTVTIPEEMYQRHVEMEVRSGREGHWDATNPQVLFYINGELVQGVDVNHREVTIAQKAQAGDTYEIAMLIYSGLEPGELIFHSNLFVIDDQIEKCYYDFLVPLQTARLLRNDAEDNTRRILTKLGRAADVIDLRKAYSKSFYESLREAEKILRKEFYTKIDEDAPIVSAVGHTHIDIAWLWTVSQTREKALRSFSTVLRLMEQYPDYKFMSSQPILYQFVKEQAPGVYEKIRQRILEGRWEADGAMWLEADCNVTGGESLVRQIMKGQKYFREEFGVSSKSLWLPDAFGYSAALPQILKRSGISYFMTTKISWNQYNQLPNDTFFWKGMDGSEVFVFMPTACDFDIIQKYVSPYSDVRNTTTYTGIIDPSMTLGTFKRFKNRDLTENTMMLYGYGDGGGGPTKEMLEEAKRLQYGMPGLPRLVLEREEDFFDRTYEKLSAHPQMPRWNGELYFEYHRGTLTSMAKNKWFNRKNETLYEQIETLASMLDEQGADYPQAVIERGWEILMLNQFHDILPGTCIGEVYKQTDREYEEIYQNGRKALCRLADTGAAKIRTKENAIVVYQTKGYDRSDVIIVEGLEHTAIKKIVEEDGRELPMQRLSDGRIAFYAEGIPAMGYKVFYYVTDSEKDDTVSLKSGCAADEKEIYTFENRFYRVQFNASLEIISLEEKETGKEFIQEGRKGNELMAYEDRPMKWDNWDIDVYYQKKSYAADTVSDVKLLEDGAVRRTLEIQKRFVDSVVTQRVHLYHDLPRIDFETHADWKEHHVLLRVNFPVEMNTAKAAYEVQFGNVERETTNNHSWDSAKFEACGHRWADLSEDNNGISLLNDCKYGYGIKEGNLSMTLIKAGTYPNENADIGEHEFTYSIYPHAGRWQDAKTVEQAYNLNVPPVVALKRGSAEKAHPEWKESCTQSFLTCGADNCFVEVIKRAEDGNGFILRMYENKNRFTKTELLFGRKISNLYECNLMEVNEREIPLLGQAAEITFRPYEIKTFRLLFESI